MGIDARGKSIFPICGELLPEGCGAGVVAQTRDEGHVAAQACGRDGLVGPFAAGIHQKSSAEYGFPRPRQAFGSDHHIGIGTADHQNFSFSSPIHRDTILD